MNKEKLTGVWEKTKETLGNISRKIWILIAVALAILAMGVAVYANTRPYTALISGASEEEMTTVRSWLQEQGVVDYRIQGADTIMVPASNATVLKARLLQEQYVNADSSWQGYFDRVSALSTVQDREVAKQAALEESLEATIRGFDNVKDVTVHINPGEDTGYVLDSGSIVNASATVTLTMDQGKLLTEGQATAIRYLMSKGVAGLKVSEVTIHDTKGNIYDDFEGGVGDSADSTALALQSQRWWENNIQSKIENMLYGAYLEENVRVAVHCDIELGDKVVNDYDVHLPEFAEDGSTDGQGIEGSRFWSWTVRADDGTVTGGLVGTPSNSDLPIYVEEGDTVEGLLGRLAAEGSIEYDNSKTQTQISITAATLKRVTVSVMINTEPESGPILVDGPEISKLVASAAGIEAPIELEEGMTAEDYLSRKVTVVGTPFIRPTPEPEEPTFLETLNAMGIPSWALFAAIGGLLLFVIILVTIILLVRRGKKKKHEKEQKAIEELMAAAMPGQTTVIIGEDGQPISVTLDEEGNPVEAPMELDENGNPVSGADVMDLHTERSMELRQNIRDYVDENMEVAALLLKSWMKEDGDNG